MIKLKQILGLFLFYLLNTSLTFAWQGGGPPPPPGDTGDGSGVTDNPELSLETPWFFILLFLLLWYFFPKINKLITK